MPEDEMWECYPKGRGTECRRRTLKSEYLQSRMNSVYSAKREESRDFYSEELLTDALSCILNALSDLYILEDFRFHWEHVRLRSINIPALKFGGDMKAIERKLLPEFPILETINLSSYSEKEATDERSTFSLDTETWRNLYCGLLFFREHGKLREKIGNDIYKCKSKVERLYLKHLKLKISHELFHQTTAKWSPDVKKHGIWTKKAIPLLEVLTELRKFLFFLDHYSVFSELEEWYTEGGKYYCLFSADYFGGVYLLLALFDIDRFWKLSDNGEYSNHMIPLIKKFLDFSVPSDSFSHATEKELKKKFTIFYKIIKDVHKGLHELSIEYLKIFLKEFSFIIESYDKKKLWPILNQAYLGINEYHYYTLSFFYAIQRNWCQGKEYRNFTENLLEHAERYLRVKSYYSIELQILDPSRSVGVITKMESESKKKSSLEEELKQVEEDIRYFKDDVNRLKISLGNLQSLVRNRHYLLQLIEQNHGKHKTIDELRRKLDELIELRKGKGNWEKGQETSLSFQKVFTELIERGKDYPLRKNPPGFIID